MKQESVTIFVCCPTQGHGMKGVVTQGGVK